MPLIPGFIIPLDTRPAKRVMALMSWDKGEKEIFKTLKARGINPIAAHFTIRAAAILKRDYDKRVEKFCNRR